MEERRDIILENELCRLTVGADAVVKSLIVKENGEECLMQGEEIALFSVTQERPFNNEIKLAHPNKRTVYQANRLRREGDRLIAGFEILPYEAVISVREAPWYITFELEDFVIPDDAYPGYELTPPPAVEVRMIQLPVRNRKNYGDWLNVIWDDAAAVNVLGLCPYTVIDSERRKNYRILYADADKSLKFRNCPAALIAAPSGKLLDVIAQIEEDYDLPRGVASRRNFPAINSSTYWVYSLNPENVDEHIAYAKKGGFRMMLVYYTAFTQEYGGYRLCGNYDFHPLYPNGMEDLKKIIGKIKAAGITPGCHFLQTHIGIESRYVTPSVDHRLNLKRHFTLARPLSADDTEIYVEQNPAETVMHPAARRLNFGGEMIAYEGYTTEPPYKFTGCQRGFCNTEGKAHPAGLIGGVLDVSEYGGTSIYLDQNSSLQDEIADKIAEFYNAGFEFFYFDGSEGVNAPCGIHVPGAQYRIYKKLNPAPLYTEGAAKAHFGWHFLSGGNAFDIFPPEKFKRAIDRYPAEEAPRMRQDFTRLNFGWWGYYLPGENTIGTQPDLFEYGTSRAAAWDCPITIQIALERLRSHPRTDDNLEVMRRWEDVRLKNWLSAEQKEMLKELGKEHILLINESGEYELVPYEQISTADRLVRAFIFERNGSRYVVFWHISGEGRLRLDLNARDILLEKELGGEQIAVKPDGDGVIVPIGGRCYLKSALSREALTEAFAAAALLETE